MEGLSNTEIVTSEGAILSHLADLALSHRPVKISPAEPSSSWMIDSQIEEIQPHSNSLYLHKPEAKSWSHLNSCRDDLEVSCYTPHGVIRFRSNYLPSSVPRLESSLRFELPQALVKDQRRAHTRVKVGHLDSSVILHIKKDLQYQGVCLDLSVAGALICLPRHKRGIDLGEIVDRCTIVVNDLIEINQSVRICSIGTKRGKLLIGTQFTDMSEHATNSLRTALDQFECHLSNSE